MTEARRKESEMGARVLERGADGLRRLLTDDSGQGTTEYAILVGVLVVIAIVAILAFRDKISELWEAISTGINSL